jgi:protein-tyrosine phosphatase
MIRYAGDNLTEIPNTGHEVFGQQLYVDIHCHCLPCIDDGPATMSDSFALCRALVKDGITKVIATPHQLGRFNGYNEALQIRNAVSTLNENLKNNNIPLTVAAGADVRVDERICQLLEADEILTLADSGKYILLELPHEIFIDVEPLLVELTSLGVQAIISHPERNIFLAKQPQILLKWLEHSAHLQITAASLLGDFGIMAQKAAWQFLSSGLASVVATDAHDLNDRIPCMKPAFRHISTKLGETTARLVCIENPLRVLEGHDLQTICSMGIRKCIDETVPSRS